MSYLEAIILGVVQGLSEFLPISSSGHLALLQNFFGVEGDRILMFTIMLHVGTLVSVFIMYARDIAELIKEFFLMIRDLLTGKGLRLQEHPMRKLGLMILWATVPTALIGVFFEDFFTSLNTKLWAIGIGWIFTGCLLFFSEKLGRAVNDIEKMNFRNGFFIGVMQGIAICPGVSRSGSTMVGGLITGLKRDFAVRFAFLISIPSILGAAVLEIPDAVREGAAGLNMGPLLVGTVVAAVCGVAAIKLMIKVVTDRKLKYFAYYVWVLGVVVIAYSIITAG